MSTDFQVRPTVNADPFGIPFWNGPMETLSADGAISIKNGIVKISKTSGAAITLAAPDSPADNGKTLYIYTSTAFAHTVVNSSPGFNNNTATATFAAKASNSFTVEAIAGCWRVMNLSGVTLS